MPSLVPGYEYDIFISYRQKDNKHDGWVTEFVDNLKGELESTFKEDISIYFDESPSDGLLETHSVNKSLENKLKCLIFIPVISQTYYDPKSFAWQHEFCAFNKLAKEDFVGRDVKLSGGNVASRILPVKIYDLDPEDKTLIEYELGGALRSIEFIYKASGVNRPLKPNDERAENLNHTYYRDQINKVANAVKEIITAIRKLNQNPETVKKQDPGLTFEHKSKLRTKLIIGTIIILAIIVLGVLFVPDLLSSFKPVEKSIAVLPFTDMSPQKDQEYFSDGIVDAILDHLFKIGDLKVIARTSSIRYKNTNLTLKEIARELGVSAILEGSVQKIGNKVRITAQLIDPKTNFHIWSETFDRDISDIFLIQSEVAQNVARELKAKLVTNETQLIQNASLTTNQLAYDFYLKGKNYSSVYKTSLSLEMHSKAILEDPSFAAAYAARAIQYLYLYWVKDEKATDYDLKALEDIKKGLSINPELPDLKIALASYYYWAKRDYDNALKIVTDLKKIFPNMSALHTTSSNILRRQGRWSESITEREKGLQLDPFNAANISELADTYSLVRQYDKAIDLCKKGLTLIPDYKTFRFEIFYNYINKTRDIKLALSESGLKEEDIQYEIYYFNRQYDKLIEFIRRDTIVPLNQQSDYYLKTYELAFIYFLSGNKSLCKLFADSSIALLREKIQKTPTDDRYYAALGKCLAFIKDNKEAIECGKKAVRLKPITLDAVQGADKEADLMLILIFTGNYELAMDKIEYLLTIPGGLSLQMVRINPVYDKLRQMPRFQKILTTEYKTQYK
jgi:TolB-like protein